MRILDRTGLGPFALAVAVFSPPIVFLVSLQVRNPYLLPILAATAIYPFYASLAAGGRRRTAGILMVLWGFSLAFSGIGATIVAPGAAEESVCHGGQYRNDMFSWLRTGQGGAGRPRLFIPLHVKSFLAFVLLTLLTCGYGGLVLGIVMFDYMNFYVGSLMLHTDRPLLTAIFGWHIWAVVRVCGYLILAILLTEISLSVVRRKKISWRSLAPWLGTGFGMILLDLFLKTLLAATWRDIIFGLTTLP